MRHPRRKAAVFWAILTAACSDGTLESNYVTDARPIESDASFTDSNTSPPDAQPPTSTHYPANTYLASLPDRNWSQIPNTRMSEVASTLLYKNAPDCCGFGIYAFSGAVKDRFNGLVYFWGGGHGDYYGNEVYRFDLKTLRWSRLTEPSPYCEAECASFDNNPRHSDGQPKSRHTYDQMVFVEHLNKIWAHGGSICGSGAEISDMWSFDIASQTWTDLDPDWQYVWNSNIARSSEYDPQSKKIYHFYSAGIRAFDPTTNQWDPDTVEFSHPSERSAVLDPYSRKIVLYGGWERSNQVSVFDLQKKSVHYPDVPVDLPKIRGPGWTFDSKNRLFVTYGGGADDAYDDRYVRYYNANTNVWFSELLENAPPLNGETYERFMYDDVNDVTYFFRSPYEDVWVLKNQKPGT